MFFLHLLHCLVLCCSCSCMHGCRYTQIANLYRQIALALIELCTLILPWITHLSRCSLLQANTITVIGQSLILILNIPSFQKRQKTSTDLSAERIERLDQIGFIWFDQSASSQNAQFRKRFDEMVKQSARTNFDTVWTLSCSLDIYADNPSLGIWWKIVMRYAFVGTTSSKRSKTRVRTTVAGLGPNWNVKPSAEKESEDIFDRNTTV